MISVCEPGPDDAWSPPRTVLERDHHLSYPFVFEHEGAIYMLPETGEAGRIELHRAVEFPDHWELDRVLLDGLTALDATLHVEDGAPLAVRERDRGSRRCRRAVVVLVAPRWTESGAHIRRTRS